MTFDEILIQVLALLQRDGRISYRALKVRFNLDDDYLEGLKDELIEARQVAIDERGKVLVWTGGTTVASAQLPVASPQPPTPSTQHPDPRPQTLDPRPISYTPPHLAERILIEQAAMEARRATDGERKTITIVFADLKGSTALIEGLDPEEARGGPSSTPRSTS